MSNLNKEIVLANQAKLIRTDIVNKDCGDDIVFHSDIANGGFYCFSTDRVVREVCNDENTYLSYRNGLTVAFFIQKDCEVIDVSAEYLTPEGVIIRSIKDIAYIDKDKKWHSKYPDVYSDKYVEGGELGGAVDNNPKYYPVLLNEKEEIFNIFNF